MIKKAIQKSNNIEYYGTYINNNNNNNNNNNYIKITGKNMFNGLKCNFNIDKEEFKKKKYQKYIKVSNNNEIVNLSNSFMKYYNGNYEVSFHSIFEDIFKKKQNFNKKKYQILDFNIFKFLKYIISDKIIGTIKTGDLSLNTFCGIITGTNFAFNIEVIIIPIAIKCIYDFGLGITRLLLLKNKLKKLTYNCSKWDKTTCEDYTTFFSKKKCKWNHCLQICGKESERKKFIIPPKFGKHYEIYYKPSDCSEIKILNKSYNPLKYSYSNSEAIQILDQLYKSYLSMCENITKKSRKKECYEILFKISKIRNNLLQQ